MNMDENITMPISVINKIRREVLENLEQKRTTSLINHREKSNI